MRGLRSTRRSASTLTLLVGTRTHAQGSALVLQAASGCWHSSSRRGAAAAAARASEREDAAATAAKQQQQPADKEKEEKERKEEKRWPYSITREVNWGELDAFNHVNNVVYFRWFETIRCAQALDLGIDLSPTARQSLILAESNCRYLKPVVWPDTVTISTRTAAIGETSWTTEFQIVSKEQGAVCALGRSRLVYYDYAMGKKIPIPQELRNKINAMEGTNF